MSLIFYILSTYIALCGREDLCRDLDQRICGSAAVHTQTVILNGAERSDFSSCIDPNDMCCGILLDLF